MWIIDLGCGTYCRGEVGVDIQFWTKNPYDRPELFDQILGGRNPNCDRICANLDYPLPLRDNCADLIIIRAVLEHLQCPFYTLKECYRILKKGGKISIVVPNAQKSKADWLDNTHLYSWTSASLRNLVSKLFKVVKIELLFNENSIYLEAVKE